MATVQEVINRLMKERGMNVSQLAIHSMLPAQSVWYVLRGGTPKISTLDMIAKGLGVNPVEILAEVTEESTHPGYSIDFLKNVIEESTLTEKQKARLAKIVEAAGGKDGEIGTGGKSGSGRN